MNMVKFAIFRGDASRIFEVRIVIFGVAAIFQLGSTAGFQAGGGYSP
jgi:hypothetical protein